MLARFHEIDSMTARNTGSGDQEEPRESFAINFSYCTNLFLFIIKVRENSHALPLRNDFYHFRKPYFVHTALPTYMLVPENLLFWYLCLASHYLFHLCFCIYDTKIVRHQVESGTFKCKF